MDGCQGVISEGYYWGSPIECVNYWGLSPSCWPKVIHIIRQVKIREKEILGQWFKRPHKQIL